MTLCDAQENILNYSMGGGVDEKKYLIGDVYVAHRIKAKALQS